MEAARYMSPINPTVFPYLTTVLLGIGTFFTAWFFVFEGIMEMVNERLKHSLKKTIFFSSSFETKTSRKGVGDLQRTTA